jgi:hypothetical protein
MQIELIEASMTAMEGYLAATMLQFYIEATATMLPEG